MVGGSIGAKAGPWQPRLGSGKTLREYSKPPERSRRDDAVEKARSAAGAELESLVYHGSRDVLEALLANPRLGEQQLIILLSRKDLPREIAVAIAQNRDWMKSYSLKLAALRQPRLPRHLAIPLLKFIYPFDLLQICSTPGIAPDLKRFVEDSILAHREGLAAGQRITMARRGLQRIAGGLLQDPDPRVIAAALDNPALTEQAVATALLSDASSPELTEAVANHSRWSKRRQVRLALVRSKHLSLARFASILPELSLGDLKDFAADPRVASNLRAYVAQMVRKRSARSRQKEV